MHVEGNCMEIDCLGFISPLEELKNDNYYSESQIYYGMNKSYELRKTGIEKVRKIRKIIVGYVMVSVKLNLNIYQKSQWLIQIII